MGLPDASEVKSKSQARRLELQQIAAEARRQQAERDEKKSRNLVQIMSQPMTVTRASTPCRYCKVTVATHEKKCSNCGAPEWMSFGPMSILQVPDPLPISPPRNCR